MRVPVKTSSLSGSTGAEAIAEPICCRIYQRYGERCGENGHDLENWLSAEGEITRRNERAIA